MENLIIAFSDDELFKIRGMIWKNRGGDLERGANVITKNIIYEYLCESVVRIIQ